MNRYLNCEMAFIQSLFFMLLLHKSSSYPKDCPVDPKTYNDSKFEKGGDYSAESNSSSNYSNASIDDRCTLYLAKSTIPGAGLGVFTGIPRKPGDVINSDDVAIPIPDLWYHLTALGENFTDRDDFEYLNVLSEYTWNGIGLGMHRESACSDDNTRECIWSFEPGVMAAINGHLGLVNADRDAPRFGDEDMHRSKDPGVGAFTPYYGTKTLATTPIPSGSEVFKGYEEFWFVDRTTDLGYIPLLEDYPGAETMLQNLNTMFEAHAIPESTQKDFWKMIHTLPWPKTRTMNAIPREFEHLALVGAQGLTSVIQQQSLSSLINLQKNGRCLDNIRMQSSTIRQAGRGAFAARFLPRGTIITGTPLLFFPSGAFFIMNDGDASSFYGYQLLLNYCLKHKESSMLLCPYGSGGVNLINHNKTLTNVQIQWAKDGQMNHDAALLNQSPSAMYYQPAPNLHIDIVALHDIQPGEELFMDYGDTWEEAWLRHVKSWPYGRDASYISPRIWNKENPNAMIRTVEEQKAEPYPDNFNLYCSPYIGWEEADVLESGENLLWDEATIGYPCTIIERKQMKDEYLYTVLYSDNEDWNKSDWIVRAAMRFEDSPYSTDIFLKEAFRQPIGLPDEMMPGAWRGTFLEPLPLY